MAKHYNITKKNIWAHELIGLKARVIESTDKGRVGIQGVIIDETKNTIVLESANKIKVLPKKEVVLEVELESGKVILDCKQIIFRPEDRIKMFWRKAG